MSRCSTNKEAWEKLFEKYNILEKIKSDGYFKISSKQINEYREARLMTKFDNSECIPKILKDNNLSILPISSNTYMIAQFNTYKKFEKCDKEIERIDFKNIAQSFKDLTNHQILKNYLSYFINKKEEHLNYENLFLKEFVLAMFITCVLSYEVS